MSCIATILASLMGLSAAAGPDRTREVSRHAWRHAVVSVHASPEHGVQIFAHSSFHKVFLLFPPAHVDAWVRNALQIVESSRAARPGETLELTTRYLFDADYSSISAARHIEGSTSTFRLYIASRGSIDRVLVSVTERELRAFLASLKQAAAVARQRQ
jgi:hypothetical protein